MLMDAMAGEVTIDAEVSVMVVVVEGLVLDLKQAPLVPVPVAMLETRSAAELDPSRASCVRP